MGQRPIKRDSTVGAYRPEPITPLLSNHLSKTDFYAAQPPMQQSFLPEGHTYLLQSPSL